MMYHEINRYFVPLKLENNEIYLSVFMSNYIEEHDEFLYDFALDFLQECDKEVGFDISVKLTDILDAEIENNRLVGEKEGIVIDIECKPLFDKTREDLLKLIDKIDSLKFK